ncbi:MAG: hypothetical protein WD009_12270 [Phycisphaeraceae bacterium]
MVQVRHQSEARFNVLLTEDRDHAIEHWTQQLPRLLEPIGVATYRARSGREALDIADRTPFHVAVIDLLTPATPATATAAPTAPARAAATRQGLGEGADDASATAPSATASASRSPRPGGLWLLEVFHRRPSRPPILVVNNGAYDWRRTQRYLNEALRLGAFTVINQPVDLEALLQAIRRLLDRQYAGHWPAPARAGHSPRPPQQEKIQ